MYLITVFYVYKYLLLNNVECKYNMTLGTCLNENTVGVQMYYMKNIQIIEQ